MDTSAERFAVVTGGTDGIGAAAARALRARGTDVVILGRSRAKADRLIAESSAVGGGSLRAIVTDLSLMTNVVSAVAELQETVPRIDFLLHGVGVLLTQRLHTVEGLELDFAVSYLSRFLFLEEAGRRGLLHPGTRMVNIAASSPKVPWYARMEFESLETVQDRTGMRGHGQAQLANDLLTAVAPRRYGVTAIGYGPGAVDTQIRREIPHVAQAVLGPLYARTTRTPARAAADVLAAFDDPDLPAGSATFRNRQGSFPAAAYVTNAQRQRDLVTISETLVAKALHPRD